MNQDERYFTVSQEVFNRFPGYVRGVVIAEGLTNGESPEALISAMRSAEDSVRKALNLEKLAEHPRIASWREAYRSFGAKPAKFRPSIEAMVRRVLRDEQLPSINTLVDIGNVVSLTHVVPAGGHAIDVITKNMELLFAKGDEEFVPLDSEQVENPLPGEVVFVEGKTVLTRRWTWRQGKHTLLVPDTTAVEFNVDGLPPVPVSEVEQACGEVMELIGKYCGGSARYAVLTQENPTIKL